MTETLSLRGLARLMGVSEKAVRKALTAGVFSDAAVRRDASGNPEVMNATLAVQDWERGGRQLRGSARRPAPSSATTLPSPALTTGPAPAVSDAAGAELTELLARVRAIRQASAGPGASADSEPDEDPATPVKDATLVEAQRDAILERGRKLRLENDLREGMLVEADQAAREAFEFARAVRENVLNIPSRLAAELAAERDAGRVHRRLETALREALESTASKLETTPVSATVEG